MFPAPKIMFNERFGLESAVLNGSKTMTRRIAKLKSRDEQYLNEAFDLDFRKKVIIDDYSRFKKGDLVAVAQSYEADLLVCRKSGVCMEFEIKRSFEDFKKDFTKDHKHDAFCISYFYYVIPEAIIKKALDLIREKIWLLYPAVLYYTEDGHLRRALDDDGKPFGNEKRRQARNLSHEEMATLGRLASLRLWNDRNEFSVTGFNRKEQEIKELKQINHRLDKNLRGLREQKFGMWFSACDVMPSDSREVLIYNYYHGVSIGWCKKGIWHTEKRDEVFVQSWCEIPAYRNILGGLDIQ